MAFQRRLRVGARGADAGPEPGRQGGDERHGDGERHQPPVVVHVEPHRISADGPESRQFLDRHVRNRETGCRPEQEQEQRLGEQLAQKTPPASSRRHANRELARARGVAHQQQAGEIGTRDEQHHGGNQREHVQRLRESRPQGVEPACSARHLDVVEVLPQQLPGAAAVSHEGLEDRVNLCGSLRGAHRRPEASNHLEPPRALIPEQIGVNGDRQRDVHLPARIEPPELRRRHSDDRVRAIAERDRPADRVGRSAKPPLPVPVADHGDRWVELLIGGGHQPAEGRSEAQQFEVIARGRLPEYLLDHAIDVNAQMIGRKGRHPRKRGGLGAETLEAGIRRGAASALRARSRDEQQLLWSIDGKRTKEHGIHEAEDGGVGAEAERQ